MKILTTLAASLILMTGTAAFGQSSEEDLASARAELQEAQRVMRETSRRMAELSRQLGQQRRTQSRSILGDRGDRAMIGILMGDAERDGGIRIIGVTPGGPSEEAGVEAGDVLVMVNGESVGTGQGIRRRSPTRMLRDLKEGDEVDLVIERDGEVKELTVTATRMEPMRWVEAPRSPEAPEAPLVVLPEWDFEFPSVNLERLEPELEKLREYLAENGELYSQYMEDWGRSIAPSIRLNADRLGRIWGSGAAWSALELAPLNPDLGQYFGTSEGVLVLAVDEDSELDLRGGDVLLRVESQSVETPREAMRQLNKHDSGESVQVTVLRDRDEMDVMLEVPESSWSGYSYSYSYDHDDDDGDKHRKSHRSESESNSSSDSSSDSDSDGR